MARRLRLRSAGHPTDATMGSGRPAQRLDIAARYHRTRLRAGIGHHRFVLLTNQRKLVREELVGRTDHQRHGRVRAPGVVTASAGALRAGGDHSRPPSPAWTCTSSDTSRSARRAASTTPSAASGPVRPRSGLMRHSGDRQRRLLRHAGGQQSRAGTPRRRITSTLTRPTAEWQQDPPGSAEEGPSETAHSVTHTTTRSHHNHYHAYSTAIGNASATATASSPPPAAAAKVRNQRRQARRRGLEQGRRSRQPDGWCDVLWISGRRWFYH